MSLYVDASALVAILTDEPQAEDLLGSLNEDSEIFTSWISVWEAAAAVARKTGRTAEHELGTVLTFVAVGSIEILAADLVSARAALVAYDRYGRRSGHAANLNLGDCFSYAFAKLRNAQLLHIGNDFILTDANA